MPKRKHTRDAVADHHFALHYCLSVCVCWVLLVGILLDLIANGNRVMIAT